MLDRGAGLAVEKRQAATGGIWPVARTPPPRDRGGTLPGRVLRMWNVETPPRSGHMSGEPTVRKAELWAGTGWPKKPMPVAERQQETEPSSVALLRATGIRITDWIPRTARTPVGVADVGQVSLWRDDDRDASTCGQVRHR